MSEEVCDFHARLPLRDGGTDQLLSTMDRHGIGVAAVTAAGVLDLDRLAAQVIEGGAARAEADNEGLLAACRSAAGRLLPFYFGNPYADPERFHRRVGSFHGLELSPAVHGLPLTDPRNLALVEVAAAAGLPIYVVCLGRAGAGVRDLVALAGKFPQATFVLGHCGFVGIDVYAVGKVAPVANIVAETSGCYTGVARVAIQRLGARRVVFGTEYPLQHPEVELTKMRALGLDRPTWQSVMWRNARRLLSKEE